MSINIKTLCFVVVLFSALSVNEARRRYWKHRRDLYKVELLPNTHAKLGESPHWDVHTQSLYYVDVDAGQLHRFCYRTKKVYKAQIEGETLAGFVIPVKDQNDLFAVGSELRVIIVQWDGIRETAKVLRTLFEVQQNDTRFEGNRFNDGKCDPRGRLFAGTMRYVGDEFEHRYGELYKYENGLVELVKTDVGISNGMAWNEKDKKFYYIDTADFDVKEYDYDFETGKVSNPSVVFDLRGDIAIGNLLPDGMTIDTDGNIYVAVFNGSTLYKVNPRNEKILLEIKLPVKQITSAAFGGPNLDILFVTTSSRNGLAEPAGSVFQVTGLRAKGYPMTNLRIEKSSFQFNKTHSGFCAASFGEQHV